jgi:anti-anti-sigma factor
MEISQTLTDTALHITLRGSFTFLENARFREVLRSLTKSNIRSLQLHLQDLTFVDSAALGMLLLIREEAKKHAISITLLGVQGQPEKMFAMVRFDSLFTMVD